MNRVQTEDTRYVRDINSKALLATDLNALYKYREEKKKKQQQVEEFSQLKDQVTSLKEDVQTIKQLLLEQLDVRERSTN